LPSEAPENLISSRKKKFVKKKNSIPFCFYQNVLTDPEKKKQKQKQKTQKTQKTPQTTPQSFS